MSSKKIIILNLFSKRLKELIDLRLKITQKAFADQIGIAENYLSMVLNEKSGPSADMLAGLFLHHSEHLEWLLTGKEIAPGLLAEPRAEYGAGDQHCEFCGDMTDEIKDLCKKVKAIVESKHPTAVPALLSNIAAFEDSVKQTERIDNLEKEVKRLSANPTGAVKSGGS